MRRARIARARIAMNFQRQRAKQGDDDAGGKEKQGLRGEGIEVHAARCGVFMTNMIPAALRHRTAQ